MIKLDDHYVDPRLVELYDIENAGRDDTEFYLDLASALHARRIIDLGCGTGVLAREFAAPGREVIGVDPAPAMLAYARRQPVAERVTWVEGDAGLLGTPDADLLVMTGNVAQVFLDDAEWLRTLAAIHAALRPGGYLAFESRNPKFAEWQWWNREGSYTRFDSPHGPMETWVEVIAVDEGRVRLEGHNVFLATGEVKVVPSELRFRSLDEITTSLTGTGFAIENVYGNWSKGPLLDTSPLMIFLARRA